MNATASKVFDTSVEDAKVTKEPVGGPPNPDDFNFFACVAEVLNENKLTAIGGALVKGAKLGLCFGTAIFAVNGLCHLFSSDNA